MGVLLMSWGTVAAAAASVDQGEPTRCLSACAECRAHCARRGGGRRREMRTMRRMVTVTRMRCQMGRGQDPGRRHCQCSNLTCPFSLSLPFIPPSPPTFLLFSILSELLLNHHQTAIDQRLAMICSSAIVWIRKQRRGQAQPGHSWPFVSAKIAPLIYLQGSHTMCAVVSLRLRRTRSTHMSLTH